MSLLDYKNGAKLVEYFIDSSLNLSFIQIFSMLAQREQNGVGSLSRSNCWKLLVALPESPLLLLCYAT